MRTPAPALPGTANDPGLALRSGSWTCRPVSTETDMAGREMTDRHRPPALALVPREVVGAGGRAIQRAIRYFLVEMVEDSRPAPKHVVERRRAVALAHHYRHVEHLSLQEIAGRLGRAPATVKAYL